MYTEFLWSNLKKGGHLEHLSVDRRIILKCILKKLDVRT